MQGPGDADEDRSGGFEHGGSQMPYAVEAAMAAIGEGMASAEGLLLGRRTYDIFAAFWPNQPADDPVAAQMNAFDKYVVSDRLDEASWENSTLIRGDELVARVTQRMDLELVDTRTTLAGVVILTYRPARDQPSPAPRNAP